MIIERGERGYHGQSACTAWYLRGVMSLGAMLLLSKKVDRLLCI
jgi:hypothetical protein